MKPKVLIISAILALGTVGSVTAFAATSSSTNTNTNTPASTSSSMVKHSHPRPSNIEAVAKILGISNSTLRTDLQSGKSIAQVAEAKGISEQTLVADLKADMQAHLTAAVTAGKLTSTKEQQMLSNFDLHATQFVEHVGSFAGPNGPGRHDGHRGPGMSGPMMGDVTTILGIDGPTLHTDLRAGQSLTQIAQTKGMSEQTLIADLKTNFKTHLDQAVKNGKLTTTKEQHMLSSFDTSAAKFVEHKGDFGHFGKGPHHTIGVNPTPPKVTTPTTTTLASSASNSTL